MDPKLPEATLCVTYIPTPVGLTFAGATGQSIHFLDFAVRATPHDYVERLARRFRLTVVHEDDGTGGDRANRVQTDITGSDARRVHSHPTREPNARAHLTALKDELARYFNGTLQTFRVPLVPHGTAFQHEVWRQVRAIPYGETRSYSDIAATLNRPRAVRAVGHANGRNPLSIVIPCHRVVQKGGNLAGYGGGLHAKRRLLEMERDAGKR